MADEQDVVETVYRLRAEQAIAELKTLIAEIKNGKATADDLGKFLIQWSNILNQSLEKTAAQFKKMDAVFSGTSTSIMSNGLKAAKGMQELGTQSEKAATKVKEVGVAGQQAAGGFTIAGGALSAALGIGALQIVRQLVDAFRDLISRGLEYETILFRLAAAQNLWAAAGKSFTVTEMAQAAADIRAQFPFFSKRESLDAVANISIMTRNLEISKEDSIKFMKAIAGSAILMGKDIDEAARMASIAISSGWSEGLQRMGFNINKAVIAQRALEMGFERTNGAFDQQATSAATLALVLEQASSVAEQAAKFQATTPGKVLQATAAWNDLKDMLGTVATAFFSGIIDKAPQALAIITKFFEYSVRGIILFTSVIIGANVAWTEFFKGNIHSLEEFKTVFADALTLAQGALEARFFPNPQDAADAAVAVDALAGAIDGLSAAEKEALQNSLDSLFEDLQRFGDQYAQKIEDNNLKVKRSDEDYQQDRLREIEDYNIKVARLIEDAANKKEEIEQEDRDRTAELEARFQEKLLELREKYLFDLEDALHARDARQILRLQRQYKMQRDQEIRQHALDLQFQVKSKAEKLADLKDETERRLKQLAEEQAIRLQRMDEDHKLRKERAAQDFQDDLRQLRDNIMRRLEQEARGIAEDLKLNKAGADAIFNLLKQYYGPNGLFDGLYDYSYNSLLSRSASLVSQLNQIAGMAGYQSSTTSVPSSGTGGSANFPRGGSQKTVPKSMPKGGGGKALVPVSRLPSASYTPSRGVSSPGGSVNGAIGINVGLSAGLVAQIVENAVEGTVDLLTQIQREK
jgi:hypothetical protein